MSESQWSPHVRDLPANESSKIHINCLPGSSNRSVEIFVPFSVTNFLSLFGPQYLSQKVESLFLLIISSYDMLVLNSKRDICIISLKSKR